MKRKPPKQLDAIADVILNYRPKSKQPKPRKRKTANKIPRERKIQKKK